MVGGGQESLGGVLENIKWPREVSRNVGIEGNSLWTPERGEAGEKACPMSENMHVITNANGPGACSLGQERGPWHWRLEGRRPLLQSGCGCGLILF